MKRFPLPLIHAVCRHSSGDSALVRGTGSRQDSPGARPRLEACPQRHIIGGLNMAWRPTEHLIEGELDNTNPGRVTGWMRFAGMNEKVIFDLQGNFHRDIRGAKIHLTGDGQAGDKEAGPYMASFSPRQTGEVGDITA